MYDFLTKVKTISNEKETIFRHQIFIHQTATKDQESCRVGRKMPVVRKNAEIGVAESVTVSLLDLGLFENLKWDTESKKIISFSDTSYQIPIK